MPGIMQLSSVLLSARDFEDRNYVAQLKDKLVDSLLDNSLTSVPSPEATATATADASCSDTDAGNPLSIYDPVAETERIISEAGKVGRSLYLYEHEKFLMAKLGDLDYVFSLDDLVRLMAVCASIPASSDKLLQKMRIALICHPSLPEFRSYYHVPTWKTVRADGTLSRNNCGTSARHSRMMKSIVLALSKTYSDRLRYNHPLD